MACKTYDDADTSKISDEDSKKSSSSEEHELLEVLEQFFENQPQAELGLAFETFIYGGLFAPWSRLSVNPPETVLHSLKDDLCFSRSDESYLGDEQMIRTRGADPIHLIPRRPRKFITNYAVPMDFIDKHFTQQFWEEEVEKQRLGAFHAEQFLEEWHSRRDSTTRFKPGKTS